ncbi:hypothetical protein BGZ94_002339 [Podila epigama]|nr:hypothetical protein BGZ94_002339 [Podila epigama]
MKTDAFSYMELRGRTIKYVLGRYEPLLKVILVGDPPHILRRVVAKLEPTVAKRIPEGQWKVEFTRHSGHASELAGQLIRDGYNVIVAVGGDGTISQVVNGYMLAEGKSKGASIGIISTGTGGDFVRSTGTPKDPVQALDVILQNNGSSVDVGHIQCTQAADPSKTREQYFINICSVGISGAIIKSVASSPLAKYISGGLVYWLYTYMTGLFYRPPPVRYTLVNGVDDKEMEQQMKLYIMAIANATYMGGNMRIAPIADMTDGKFDCVCLHGLTITDAFFKASPALKSGNLMAMPAHQAFTERNTKVTMSPVNLSSAIYIEADGELAGILPATWHIVPKGCLMILPKKV